MEITVRRARPEDKPKVFEAERQATKNLQYLPETYEMFMNDPKGEFIVAECDGEVVAVGNFAVVPDGSAWLEALRVLPARQGLGIGKRFYERFFELARQKGIGTMRMYTGFKNVVSRGLAERFGFRLACAFRGMFRNPDVAIAPPASGFVQVTDPVRATELIMGAACQWSNYLVMNRTFFALSPALCQWLCENDMVYEQKNSGSLVVCGARFMQRHALHLGLFYGNADECARFANKRALLLGVPRIICTFPVANRQIEQALDQHGYLREESDTIVMEGKVS